MAFNTSIISVGSDATSLIVSNTSQKKRILKNIGTYDVFLGSDGSVTITNGFPVGPGEQFSFNDYNGALYGIIDVTGSEAINIHVLEDE